MSEFIRESSILIVDDRAPNIKFLKQMLEASGYADVQTCQDSRNVFSMIGDLNPNLLLLDLEMPYVDGFDVLDYLTLHKLHNKISVLVLTAAQEREQKHRALDLGAADYLSKPFDRREVILRIENILRANLHTRFLENEKDRLDYLVGIRTSEVMDTQLEIVRRLGKAAEFKDNETGMHIIRMSKYSELLAKALGLPDNYCHLILHASPMHDIGKIGIPDAILQKPGRLNPAERKIMMTHALVGGQILGEHNSELLKMAKLIAESHHEKWDGTGYPHGLQGEQIPLGGRIVAIGDVFDALTSNRPYKTAWSIEESKQYLIENKGKHFEPELVDIFLTRMDRVLDIKSKYEG